jgi:hypothetical protein
MRAGGARPASESLLKIDVCPIRWLKLARWLMP